MKKWKNKGYALKLLTKNQAIIVNGEHEKIVEV